MVDEIEAAFPRLRGGNYQVTSPREDAYNCVAWAVGDTSGNGLRQNRQGRLVRLHARKSGEPTCGDSLDCSVPNRDNASD
jgi:hypothetical protein